MRAVYKVHGTFLRIVTLLALALCLVSNAQAQNVVITSVPLGATRIRTQSALPNANLTYRVSLPANASQVIVDLENPVGGPATYTLTFQDDNQESTGVGPALNCYRVIQNGLTANNTSGSFSAVALASVSHRYSCPAPPSHRLNFSIFANAGNTDQTAIWLIVDTGQTLWSATQSAGASAGNQYNHISTATSTVIKSTAGFLHTLTINTTAAGVITVFDNTSCSGTTIAAFAASATIGTYTYDVAFTTGLCVTTGAASDVTVSFR